MATTLIIIHRNKRNPNFAKQIPIDYRFEERQALRFVVLDVDKEDIGHNLKAYDKIGQMV